MGILSDVLSPITDVIGLGYNIFSGERANAQQQDWNQKSFEEQVRMNDWNQQAFQQNMDWQKTLATSSNQMRVKDLEAAGLNPVLAAGSGTISSPPISAGVNSAGGQRAANASSINESALSNTILRNASLELQRQQVANETRLADAQVELTQAQAGKVVSDTGVASREADIHAFEASLKDHADTRSQELHKGALTSQELSNRSVSYYVNTLQPAEFRKLLADTALSTQHASESQSRIDLNTLQADFDRTRNYVQRFSAPELARLNMTHAQLENTIDLWNLERAKLSGLATNQSPGATTLAIRDFVNRTYASSTSERKQELESILLQSAGTLNAADSLSGTVQRFITPKAKFKW
jgi:hypothetical protein